MRPISSTRPLLLSAVVTLLTLTACTSFQPAREAARRLPLEPCVIEGLEGEALCGTYPVWEDRQARAGHKIPIRVIVLPALGPDPAPDPLFLFAGGPGESIAGGAGVWGLPIFNPLRERRDVVLVDQRGTGGSHLLQCRLPGSDEDVAGYFEDFLDAGVAEACRRELEERADLSLYTTSIAMDDVDEVREWLGYERINLSGGSYGTRAAQVYMRRHPESVRSAILLGVTALRQHLPLYHARDGREALDGILQLCARDEACNAAFPKIAAEHREVLRRLDQEPARAMIPHPETGEPVEVTIRRPFFAEQIRFMAYTAQRSTVIPLIIHRAYEGDFTPFARISMLFEPLIRQELAFGMFLSVTCAEDIPFMEPEEIEAAVAGTYLGDYRVRMQQEACEHWVRGEIPAGFHDPVLSDAPVLLVSGPYDPVTPPSWAEEVAEHLPNGHHLVIPQGHHGPFGLSNLDCFVQLQADFLDRGSAQGLDTSCVETMERPPFVTSMEELEALISQAQAEG